MKYMYSLYHNDAVHVRSRSYFVAAVVFCVFLVQFIQVVVPIGIAYANTRSSGSSVVNLPHSALDSTTGKITIHQLDTVHLISETGSIPLTITNDLNDDVVLRLDATSEDSNRLEVWGINEVFVHANSEQKVALPIHAKANGVVKITTNLKLKNLDFGKMSFTVQITRSIGDVVSVVFYVIIVLLLTLGIFRTIRSHRRSQNKSAVKQEDVIV
ncbi:MAG: DUF6049 family protein [Candidatus Ancillula sp.]|nr:DUF6049 family protein [Candidatus Ancillula sp.]